MSDIDDRIAAALRAAANQVDERDLRPDVPPSHTTMAPRRRPVRWIAPVIAAAAVAGIAISVTAVVDHHPNANRPLPPGVTSHSTGPTSAVTSPTTPAVETTPPTSPAATVAYACYFADVTCGRHLDSWYVPLWPFASYQQAQQWQGQQGGSQPWHLDAGETALNFTRGYLGFTDITRVTSSDINANEAKIGVGYLNPNGVPVTAAVLHLVRYEQYPNTKTAPWEVVGSEDTTLSLEQPAYGSHVGSQFTAGGHITGVDENLRILTKSASEAAQPRVQTKPAGGDNSPWSIKVSTNLDGPLTVVVSTGGHVQEHERFAIQGIYVTPSS